ncbi:hypothetical protein HCN44_004048 [Aphidius gifuensis]|uniref:Uncharacterized protein n=1 Tax=Aphidius gifuensis TaxID=684658 RepID=A0A834Y0Z2_APHGI|nr:hypothetical protein HCN44_004048 [Aphidius gifuensis]
MKITTRGPHAFSKFVNILKKTGYKDLANLLEEKTAIPTATTTASFMSLRDNKNNIAANNNNNSNNNSNYSASSPGDDIDNLDFTLAQLENINDFDLQNELGPLKVVVEKTTKFEDHPSILSVYPMCSNPRGLVLIIRLTDYVHEPLRNGSEHDEKNLKDLFEQMGFKTICKSNLTGDQIHDEIRTFSQNPDLNYVDSCFVIISGHGSRNKYVEESYISGIDSHVNNRNGNVYWSEIISYFSHDKCEALRNKPKVFIFQSCRGQEEQMIVKGINNDENIQSINDRNCFHDESELIFDSDNYRDILIASATIPNFVSYRDGVTGSWFITTICYVFMKYANTYHIRKLFILIDNRKQVSRPAREKIKHQTLIVENIGFKQMYINPGLFQSE